MGGFTPIFRQGNIPSDHFFLSILGLILILHQRPIVRQETTHSTKKLNRKASLDADPHKVVSREVVKQHSDRERKIDSFPDKDRDNDHQPKRMVDFNFKEDVSQPVFKIIKIKFYYLYVCVLEVRSR